MFLEFSGFGGKGFHTILSNRGELSVLDTKIELAS